MGDIALNLRMIGQNSDQELRSLYEWLLNEHDLRPQLKVKLVHKEPGPGEMGDTLDLISMIIASTLALPGFIQAISEWRRTRRNRPQVVIERGETTVTISKANSDIVVDVLDAIQDHK